MKKASTSSEVTHFEQIPNIGPRIADDFKLLGIRKPADLADRDAFDLYQKLCKKTGHRHDPCVLDTFMAAVDFMNGAAAKSWWSYTAERKRLHPDC
jgi:alpha-glucosidase (family GH31 glycosyl hydrolase)